ncbi:MAG: efflux RND transporter permease subunit, partial [Leptospirales bacterium]
MENQYRDRANAIRKPGILDRVIRMSLERRGIVLGAALLLFAGGGYMSDQLPVDVFPDLNRPVVTVLAEAHGLAASEVETLVTIPLESAVLGAPGVIGVRSSSKRGIAMLRVEFDWGADIYRCRQTISERIAAARQELPEDTGPALGPISSIMGEILLIGLTAPKTDSEVQNVSLRDLRTFADWKLRRRLLAVPGVSNVTVLGGEAKVYEVAANSERLAAMNLGFLDLQRALSGVGGNTGGGFFEQDGREFVYRNLGSIYQLDELNEAAVGFRAGIPVRAKDVARVRENSLPRRGDAGVNGAAGVIVAIQKQPGASTLRLTDRIAHELSRLQTEAGPTIQIHGELFRQADFIERAIENVIEAMRDGSIIVALVLILFLWNVRTTFITLLALPLSLIGGVLALSALGFGINTMTLGGLAVAVGELVDDAIVDVENCFRRLRENRLLAQPRPALEVVFEASSEIRNSIVLATLVVILVFVPLFFLGGVEGRLFQPLAVAYILAIIASLVVALTVTPVLCYYLLPNYRFHERESVLVRALKRVQEVNLRRIIQRPLLPIAGASALFVIALAITPILDRA